jgi:hypothetical protein
MTQSLLIASIGTKLVKGILSIWLKDQQVAKLAADLSLDLFEHHTKDFYEARKAKRFFEELADRVATELTAFIDSEHRALPKGDAKQIMECSIAIISGSEFYDLCIAERLSFDRIFVSSKSKLASEAKERGLNRNVLESIFRFLLMEFVTVLSSLPQFNRVVFRKILEDTEIIVDKISSLQSKLDDVLMLRSQANSNDVLSSTDDEAARHEHEYRTHFARRFRKLQLFGIDSRGLDKRYDLSIGYISLTISSDDGSSGSSTEEALGSDQVLESTFNLITGAPGSGKTTILSWLALNCADRTLQHELSNFNSLIPVFFSF